MKGYVDTGIKEGAKLLPSTAVASRCRATRTAYFMGGCAVRQRHDGHENLQRRDLSGPCCRTSAPRTTTRHCALPSEHEYGNGVAIYTRDGDTARDFVNKVQGRHGGRELRRFRCRWPITPSAAGRGSGFGDLNQHGPDSIRFYTKTKTVTSRWPSGVKEGAEFSIPTMK